MRGPVALLALLLASSAQGFVAPLPAIQQRSTIKTWLLLVA